MKISIEDFRYPEQLKKIHNPPKQLYVKGNIELLNTIGLAIIGSRSCTKYGEEMANNFAKELSVQGFTIISGMAKGIDSFAHISSLKTTGNTIAVLPSGFNNIFPEENIDLFDKIIMNNGLIVTEYKENVKASYKKFLDRNRIVSGLAIGTLVIEGGYRSGTSVTANLTISEGKKVFCIPSSLDNPKGITPNKLIKEGAYLVTEVQDIIKEYSELNLDKCKINRKDNKKHFKQSLINEEYLDVYNILDNEKFININEIVRLSNLEIDVVNYKLMMLELDDVIVSFAGSNFKRK